jgi:hypothetical protein
MTTYLQVLEIHRTFENELMNAFKRGHGRILDKPLMLDTDDGKWAIIQVGSLVWIGPATLVCKVKVGSPIQVSRSIRNARLELNLSDRHRNGELAVSK